MDKRHLKRIQIVQNLYAMSFKDAVDNLPEPKEEKTKEIVKNLTAVDLLIDKHSDKLSIDKISKTDLAILRLAVYELTIEKMMPPKVIIDEAVELAKEMGSDKSYAFVNAVLGKIINE